MCPKNISLEIKNAKEFHVDIKCWSEKDEYRYYLHRHDEKRILNKNDSLNWLEKSAGDVYAMGLIIFELLACEIERPKAWIQTEMREIFLHHFRDTVLDPLGKNLVHAMTQRLWQNRISAEEAMQHPFSADDLTHVKAIKAQ